MKYKLEIIVFTTGAVLMIFELLGSRMLAPFIGTSIYVWSSIIGVIMASLSLGYYFGGKLADKRADYLCLSLILFIAGTAILVTYFSYESILIGLVSLRNLEIIALISSVVLFAIPGILIGSVTPYAVKLKLKDVKLSGTTVGTLYSISTFGSIVGTFLAGFLFIPHLGTKEVIVAIGLLLVILSFLLERGKAILTRLAVIIIFLLVIFLLIPKENAREEEYGLFTYDSAYSQIFVKENEDLVELHTDVYGIQSAMLKNNSEKLVLEYTKYFRLDRLINDKPNKSLMIGGCGYSYPKDYLKSFPKGEIDVVEIDPKMTEIAKEHFDLEDSERMRIFHEDGRTYLNRSEEKYDFIYLDAFDSIYIPHHLTTVEAVKKAYDSLKQGGAVFVNIISAIEGDKGKFFRAEHRTYKEVFPQVLTFQIDENNPENIQNIMLVAIKSENHKLQTDDQELQGYLKNLWSRNIEQDVPVLRDNYAPVEYYMRKVF